MKITATLSLLLVLAAASARPAEAKVRIVSTLQDFASIAQAVGGDDVQTDTLAKGYQDPHFVDAKPSFILKLARADLLIVAGLELEIGYLPPLIDQARNAKIHKGSPGYLDVSVGCDILQRPTTFVTRAMGDVHPYGNPHYWTDPDNGRAIAEEIAAKLTELDPAHAADYAKNLAAFKAELAEKDKEWRAIMAPYAGAKVVTFHDSWPNFAKHFNIDIVGHVEPKPGIPPTPSHTLEIINLIKADHVRAIMVEPYYDLKTPKYIAKQTGATVVHAYPSVGGEPEIKTYFDLFDVDLANLTKALGAPKP